MVAIHRGSRAVFQKELGLSLRNQSVPLLIDTECREAKLFAEGAGPCQLAKVITPAPEAPWIPERALEAARSLRRPEAELAHIGWRAARAWCPGQARSPSADQSEFRALALTHEATWRQTPVCLCHLWRRRRPRLRTAPRQRWWQRQPAAAARTRHPQTRASRAAAHAWHGCWSCLARKCSRGTTRCLSRLAYCGVSDLKHNVLEKWRLAACCQIRFAERGGISCIDALRRFEQKLNLDGFEGKNDAPTFGTIKNTRIEQGSDV
jgi:hypothetical protein